MREIMTSEQIHEQFMYHIGWNIPNREYSLTEWIQYKPLKEVYENLSKDQIKRLPKKLKELLFDTIK